MATLVTESGNRLMMETVPGISSASSLNDISIVEIVKYTFETDPTLDGWLVGNDWTWNSTDDRMDI